MKKGGEREGGKGRRVGGSEGGEGRRDEER